MVEHITGAIQLKVTSKPDPVRFKLQEGNEHAHRISSDQQGS